MARSGTQLSTYDIAVAATGEYTEFHGGTVEDGMSAITKAINRVSGLYETEFAIAFQLVGDNDFSITPQAVVSLSLENSPLAEDGGVATVRATLDAATTENVTVNLAYDGTAINNTDYNAATLITITAGQTTGSINLTGVDDSLVEGDETIIVDVDNVINALENGTQQVTATITDDESNGTSGNDSLSGDDGDNTLNGEGGKDRLYGEGGNDNIDGGANNDFISSGDNNDTVTGGDGRDIIYGNDNDDILVGGNGNDTLSGGTFNPVTNISNGTDNSQDRLRGDSGSDIFVIHANNTGDIIYDFENDIDKLGLSGGLSSSDLNISDDGSSTTIALSGGNTLAT